MQLFAVFLLNELCSCWITSSKFISEISNLVSAGFVKNTGLRGKGLKVSYLNVVCLTRYLKQTFYLSLSNERSTIFSISSILTAVFILTWMPRIGSHYY